MPGAVGKEGRVKEQNYNVIAVKRRMERGLHGVVHFPFYLNEIRK